MRGQQLGSGVGELAQRFGLQVVQQVHAQTTAAHVTGGRRHVHDVHQFQRHPLARGCTGSPLGGLPS